MRALDGVDLTLAPGEVHGFLGPNGAGKSTTIRILLGLLRRDTGKVDIWGLDPWDNAVELHHRMAYVPADVMLWPNLTGGESIDALSRMRKSIDPKRRASLIERFDLDPSKRSGTYSKGNRQKVAIIAALAADVEFLVLDEPTTGLDPLMESVFSECIEEERARGRTVLLSSHTLAQVERLCTKLSIIKDGRIVENGSLAELRHLTRSTVRAGTSHPVPSLGQLAGVHDVREEQDEIVASVDADALQDVIGALHRNGLTSLVVQPPSLEALFLRHYAHGPSEA